MWTSFFLLLQTLLCSANFDWEVSWDDPHLHEYEWIDIREFGERPFPDFLPPPRFHFPMSNIVPFLSLDADHKFLLICERGVRSAFLVEKLFQLDRHQFYSLKGGLVEIEALQ